jgi:hypothetical protein
MNTIARDEVDVVAETNKHQGPDREQLILEAHCLHGPQKVYHNGVRYGIQDAKDGWHHCVADVVTKYVHDEHHEEQECGQDHKKLDPKQHECLLVQHDK